MCHGLVSTLAAAGQMLLWECRAVLRVGYRPDAATPLTMALRTARHPWLPLPMNVRCRLCRQCLLGRGALQGKDDMASGMVVFITSQSPHRFYFLTWHSQWFLQTVSKLSEASSLFWLHLGRALSSGKILEPPCPCSCSCKFRWCRHFHHEASHPANTGCPGSCFLQKSPPQFRTTRYPVKTPTAFLLLSVGICLSAHTGNRWKFSSGSQSRKWCVSVQCWERLKQANKQKHQRKKYSVGPFCLQ